MKNAMKPTDKWCPMARLAVSESEDGSLHGANRFTSVDTSLYMRVRCFGENCAVFVGDDSTGHCGLMRG